MEWFLHSFHTLVCGGSSTRTSGRYASLKRAPLNPVSRGYRPRDEDQIQKNPSRLSALCFFLRSRQNIEGTCPVIWAVKCSNILHRTRMDGIKSPSLVASPASTACTEKIYAIAESKSRTDCLAPWQRTSIGSIIDWDARYFGADLFWASNLFHECMVCDLGSPDVKSPVIPWSSGLSLTLRKSNACIIHNLSVSTILMKGLDRLTIFVFHVANASGPFSRPPKSLKLLQLGSSILEQGYRQVRFVLKAGTNLPLFAETCLE